MIDHHPVHCRDTRDLIHSSARKKSRAPSMKAATTEFPLSELTELARWASAKLALDTQSVRLDPPRADASFRRYQRLRAGSESWMLCDAPPAREKNAEFLAIAEALSRCGVRAPKVLAVDLDRGWLCLEDLGDRLLLPELREDTVDRHYAAAMNMLRRLALCDSDAFGLPPYDRAALQEELSLFPRWFCEGLLHSPLDRRAGQVFDDLCGALCERALAQTQVVVHRDFHARNLMLLPDDSLATIDFQDALTGPLTYDLVSLLRDCYCRWPSPRVTGWVRDQHAALSAEGVSVPAVEAFHKDFDWMGLQRHIKVLGIFARLWLRDGKRAYLGDLPRVLAYVREVLSAYAQEPALAAFHDLLEQQWLPLAQRQDWYRAP